MLPQIEDQKTQIADLCRRFHVRRLDLFGSAGRGGGFSRDTSDIDLLVSYEPEHDPPSLESYFALRAALADLLGRPVDLVVSGSIRNPYVHRSIDQSRETVFAA